MGSNWSSLEQEPSPDPWWPPLQPQTRPLCDNSPQVVVTEEVEESQGLGERGRMKQAELEAFKQELARKRALRNEALAALQAEMRDLRSQVEEERRLRLEVEMERDTLRSSASTDLSQELQRVTEQKKQLEEEKERLMEEVEEKAGLERQVQALKDVSQIGKEMLRIRELQVKELKKKLVEINLSTVLAPPEDLRVEYEKQIDNIRKLRTLYEERAAATMLEHQRALEREEAKREVIETKLADLQKETEDWQEMKKELELKNEKLEGIIQKSEDDLDKLKDDLFSSTVQNKSLSSQITLINNLFSQMLVSPKVDLDRLTRLLKDNHGLITDLTEKGDSNEVAALLVDLAGQVEKEQEEEKKQEQNSEDLDKNVESQTEIASNLSKVWRVMVELLSHHQSSSHVELAGGAESCYKCIQTPTGPRSVISVSQTFLTLKDLILEKNRLVKEVGRLKTLNNHLEYRLGSQEKRLSVVTTELRKTWGVFNKLRAQHKQLHTHEKILRYELQQKRCMLTELKEELEHCRDKWERARQKNTQTEEDWKKLRKEFASRKSRTESNSAESGYEEEDVAVSPPSETINHGNSLFEIRPNNGSEAELSEEDIEHSDGNSYDTVIDLLDIACLENQSEGESTIPFVLCEVPTVTSEISPSLLPLSGSEFTEGLDQIESEDLAAVLDIQYQTQLLGADYNLSLPSSSGSSPIPTENDDFASSEMDISEEDSLSNDNHIYSSPLPTVNQPVQEETLLFGSNSSKNISKFLDGLFVDQPTRNRPSPPQQNLFLDIPSTSQSTPDNDPTTPIVNNGSYQILSGSATPLISGEECYEFPVKNEESLNENKSDQTKLTGMEHVQQWVIDSQPPTTVTFSETERVSQETKIIDQIPLISSNSETNTQEDILKAREDRLKKLEKQCRSLVSKVSSTSFRSEIISNKLDELHLCYGSTEEGPVNIESKEKHNVNQVCNLPEAQEQETTDLSEQVTTSSKSVIPLRDSKDAEAIACSSNSENLSQVPSPILGRSPEQILEARAARLKRLEDQCKSLFSKMAATSSRSDVISNKLDELHESYGSSEQSTINEKPMVTNTYALTSGLVINQNNKDKEIMGHSDEKKSLSVHREEIKDSKPPDLASESKEILNKCSIPGPSTEPIPVVTGSPKTNRTPEEILAARAERFKRLEEQCKSLVSKMTATSLRSEIISNKLDELHSCYGSSEDTSDNDEHSSSSLENDRRRSTPTSSPRNYRRMIHSTEKDKTSKEANAQDLDTLQAENMNERIKLQQETNTEPDRLKRTPEEILQARGQLLNRLEEQCKSLFSKMSATSQRSDLISNRLEELHGQYGQSTSSDNQPQSSEQTKLPTSFTNSADVTEVSRECQEELRHSQNTNDVQTQNESNTSDITDQLTDMEKSK
uniref:Uncharacterized protein n=1 Tax=Homalodisca liturata TaxID=320908 RepID=A0A1B6IPM1_9HEMI